MKTIKILGHGTIIYKLLNNIIPAEIIIYIFYISFTVLKIFWWDNVDTIILCKYNLIFY